MAYVAWSVVFGEQPTAAKWNILGTNDASFHDGTGIDDDVILARHIDEGVVLPYHLNSALTALTNWDWQTWTPTVVGWSSFTSQVYKYCIIGKVAFVEVEISGTSNSTSASITIPFTANVASGKFAGVPMWTVSDNGTPSPDVGRAYISGSGSLTTIIIERTLTGTAWTASGNKSVRFTGIFAVA